MCTAPDRSLRKKKERRKDIVCELTVQKRKKMSPKPTGCNTPDLNVVLPKKFPTDLPS